MKIIARIFNSAWNSRIQKKFVTAACLFMQPYRLRALPGLRNIQDAWYWILAYPVFWRYVFRRARMIDGTTRSGSKRAGTRYIAITSAHMMEGIGGQLMRWNTALNLACLHEVRFVHTPFTASSHDPGVDWERVLRFGDNEISILDIARIKRLKRIVFPPMEIAEGRIQCFGWSLQPDFISSIMRSVSLSGEVLFELSPPTWAYDQTRTRAILKRKFRAVFPFERQSASNRRVVAVHVRRGDVAVLNARNREPWRWIEADYYAEVCLRIINTLGSDRVQLEFYSDGDDSDLAELINLGAHLRIPCKVMTNGSPVSALCGMANADILVVGSSAFSYFAGLVSDGLKIIRSPWVHKIPNDPDWILCDGQGNFETNPLLALTHF